MTRTELKQIIRDKMPGLTRNDRLVADFILEQFDRIPVLNVDKVARENGISTASVVRFCQKLGWDGFAALREAITDSFKGRYSPYHLKEDIRGDVLATVAKQDIRDIQDTLLNLQREDFDKLIRLIMDARCIYTAGLGVSYLLAQLFTYQLNQVGRNARSLVKGDLSFLEQALHLGRGDVLIVISYPPYSRETVELARFVQARGVAVVAITDRTASPVTACSDLSIVVKSENVIFTNSFAAISVFINSVVTECAKRDRSGTEALLEESRRINSILGETLNDY